MWSPAPFRELLGQRSGPEESQWSWARSKKTPLRVCEYLWLRESLSNYRSGDAGHGPSEKVCVESLHAFNASFPLLACSLLPAQDTNVGAILGRVLALPLILLVYQLWIRRELARRIPARPVETPPRGSGGRLAAGMSSHGPDGVVANFRIECPVDGSNVVFSTIEAANAWLLEHKQRCRFHAGMLAETRVAGEPITAWMAWNHSKWGSRWWWYEPMREWHWIEAEWRTCSETQPDGEPPKPFLVHRLSGGERPIVPGAPPGASRRDHA